MPTTASTLRFFRARVTAITELTPELPPLHVRRRRPRRLRRPRIRSAHQDRLPHRDGRRWTPCPTATTGTRMWREMPESERPPFRTYTTRQVRNDACEVDVDMVAHDVQGPASAWIAGAAVGDEVLILAPTTAHDGRQLRHRLRAARADRRTAPRRRRDGGAGHRGHPRAAPRRGARHGRPRGAARGRRRLPAAPPRVRVPRRRPRRRPASRHLVPAVAGSRRRARAGGARRRRSPRSTSTPTSSGRCRAPRRAAPHSRARRSTRGSPARPARSSPCDGTWSPSRESTGARSRSWATGGSAERRTDRAAHASRAASRPTLVCMPEPQPGHQGERAPARWR